MCSLNKPAIAALAFFVAACSQPGQPGDSLYPFIAAQEVTLRIQQGEHVQFIDTRQNSDFLNGHIPGAVNLTRYDVSLRSAPYAGKAQNADSLALTLGRAGIRSDASIVIYDDAAGTEASRLWWLLNTYGYSNAGILQEGIQGWNTPLTQEIAQHEPTIFRFTGHRLEGIADHARTEAIMRRGHAVLIDARSLAEFDGSELKAGAAYAGHIPGAVHLCYSGNYITTSTGDRRLKHPDSLRTMYAAIASPDDTVIVYCHSGVRSSLTSVVLRELLGYKHVYNFEGSWVEWSYYHTPEHEAEIYTSE